MKKKHTLAKNPREFFIMSSLQDEKKFLSLYHNFEYAIDHSITVVV